MKVSKEMQITTNKLGNDEQCEICQNTGYSCSLLFIALPKRHYFSKFLVFERKEVVIYKKDIFSALTSNSLLVASRVN